MKTKLIKLTEETKTDIVTKAILSSPDIKERESKIKDIFKNVPDIKKDGIIKVLDWMEEYILSHKED